MAFSGWGKLSINGPSSNVLMKVNLNVVPIERCAKVYERVNTTVAKQICTHHPSKDACQVRLSKNSDSQPKIDNTRAMNTNMTLSPIVCVGIKFMQPHSKLLTLYYTMSAF